MLAEVEIRKRLIQSESEFIERKASNPNDRDLRETLVAFANSVPESEYAVLFLGVADNGDVTGIANADSVQKGVRRVAQFECYPPVDCTITLLAVAEKEVLAVIVGHSKTRPHFTGHALVRKGSENVKADEYLYKDMIASHNDKARRLIAIKGQKVIVELRPPKPPDERGYPDVPLRDYVLRECDAIDVTIEDIRFCRTITEPLEFVQICRTTHGGKAMKLIFTNVDHNKF